LGLRTQQKNGKYCERNGDKCGLDNKNKYYNDAEQ